MDTVQPGQQSDAALPGILLGALDVLTVERRGPEAIHGQRQLRILDVQRCRESGRPVASLRGHPLLRRQHERSGDRSLDRPAGVGEGADAVQWDHAVKEGTVMRSLIVPALVIATLLGGASAPASTGGGLVSKRSAHTVDQTLDRLEAALKDARAKIVARLDHTAEAKAIGQSIRPSGLR